MIVGYLILAALAFAFFAVGIKGFTSKGLPLTRRKNLTGPAARAVGAGCILVGLGIVAAGIWDYVVTYKPRPGPPTKVVSPKREQEINEYGPAEFAHEMDQRTAAEGFVSLFDGKTTFGWSDGKVEEGLLVRGTSTADFQEWLNVDVARPGKLTLSGEERILPHGGGIVPGPRSAGKIKLEAGIAISKLWIRPKMKSLLHLRNPVEMDLSAWKRVGEPAPPKGNEARWEVSNNVLRGAGGRGAFEYTGERFGDLLLQAEVRTGARHAKGAIYVRCKPGLARSGYEIPIYNSCENKDTSRPGLRSTGSIAGHQNARRLVSHDGEFCMITVLAHGRHLTTWVNGYQQTDWVDTRPINENAQQGSRAEPGTIQLWIDGPEADLEFRQIQVREPTIPEKVKMEKEKKSVEKFPG